MNIIITGHKRHGKDTACDYIKEQTGLTFTNSSFAVAEEYIFPKLKELYGYQTLEECYNDRVNHRKEWYDLICDYNEEDKAKMGKLIFSQSNIYCGLRNIEELKEMRKIGLVDTVIWVDASERLPPEDVESMTITQADCNIVINNNRGIQEFHNVLDVLIMKLKLYTIKPK